MSTQMPDFVFKFVNQVDEPNWSASDFKTCLDARAKEIRDWLNATHIGTDKIHIGVIGSAAGSTSGPTTTSTTYVDLTDMSFSITTSGGDILVFFVGGFQNSAAGNQVLLQLYVDAAGGGAVSISEPVSGYVFSVASIFRFTGISAGAHTIKAKWAVTAGTGTALSTTRYLTALEVKQ